MLLRVGEEEFVRADGGHQVLGPVSQQHGVEAFDDLGCVQACEVVVVQESVRGGGGLVDCLRLGCCAAGDGDSADEKRCDGEEAELVSGTGPAGAV